MLFVVLCACWFRLCSRIYNYTVHNLHSRPGRFAPVKDTAFPTEYKDGWPSQFFLKLWRKQRLYWLWYPGSGGVATAHCPYSSTPTSILSECQTYRTTPPPAKLERKTSVFVLLRRCPVWIWTGTQIIVTNAFVVFFSRCRKLTRYCFKLGQLLCLHFFLINYLLPYSHSR